MVTAVPGIARDRQGGLHVNGVLARRKKRFCALRQAESSAFVLVFVVIQQRPGDFDQFSRAKT
jgi:hypothetical protein